MMEYKEGEVIVATPCDHVFHKRCCKEWFQLSRTCPVCRLDVPECLGIDSTVESGSEGTVRRGEIMPNIIRIIRRDQRESNQPEAHAVVELPHTNNATLINSERGHTEQRRDQQLDV